MSIAIITACWKRPETFNAFLLHTLSLNPAPVAIVCAGSPGDECEDIARGHGIRYEQVPNEMGLKWNHVVGMASKVKATHYLFMGSDDMMDQPMWEYYQSYQGQHLSLRDLFFYDGPTQSLVYWPGYIGRRAGEPIGAAKLVRRDVLAALHWKPFDPRPERWNALDYDMHMAIRALGVKVKVVRMSDTGGVCLDVKDAGSCTPWDKILIQPGIKIMNRRWLERRSPQLHEALSYL
jgi:hypothetical protein